MKSNDRDIAGQQKAGFAELLRTWRLLLVLLGLAVVVLLFYGEEDWRGYHVWQSYKQQMADRGEPTEPETFIPQPVPDDQNFAMTPALAPLFQFVSGTQHWRDPNAPSLFQSLATKYDAAAALVKPPPANRLNSWVRPPTDLNVWAGAFLQGTNRQDRVRKALVAASYSSGNAAAQVLQDLEEFNPVLEELRAASHRPRSRFNLRYEEDNPAVILLPHLSNLKHLCQVLQLRASAEVSAGHTDDALADIELMFQLTDSIRDEPVVISQLVRMAQMQMTFQTIAEGLGKWSEPQLRALQEHLQSHDFLRDVHRALEAERVLFGGGVIEYVRRSANKFHVIDEFARASDNGGSEDLSPVGLMLTVAPRGWLYLEQRNHSRSFGQYLLPVIELTNRVVRPEAARAADAGMAQVTRGSPAAKFLRHELFSSILLPAISRLGEKVAFTQTGVDLAAIACALERYRLAQGQFPDALDKLAPRFIAALPHDVINGKPLNYQLESGHYRLYSVGWNAKDDGGFIPQNKNGGIDQHEGDWVWADTL